MRKHLLLYFSILFITIAPSWAQDVEFSASAPSTVVQGNRFQLVYSVNQEASNLRVPDIADFQILMGPSTSQSSSVQIINNNVTRSINESFT